MRGMHIGRNSIAWRDDVRAPVRTRRMSRMATREPRNGVEAVGLDEAIKEGSQLRLEV